MNKSNLIFIPGWNIRAEIFKPFTYLLTERFNCHLLTPPLGGNYAAALKYFLKYITEHKLQNISLLGWSMGGQLALLLAGEIKTEKIILLNSAAVFSRREEEKKSFYELCRTDFLRAVKYFHKLMGTLSPADSILLKNNFINDQTNALNYLKDLQESDLSAAAKKIKSPAVIIHALYDQIIPYAEAEYLQSLMPQALLQTLETDFHFPFFNHYAKITPTITGQELREYGE